LTWRKYTRLRGIVPGSNDSFVAPDGYPQNVACAPVPAVVLAQMRYQFGIVPGVTANSSVSDNPHRSANGRMFGQLPLRRRPQRREVLQTVTLGKLSCAPRRRGLVPLDTGQQGAKAGLRGQREGRGDFVAEDAFTSLVRRTYQDFEGSVALVDCRAQACQLRWDSSVRL
jgi:hypothetical protein